MLSILLRIVGAIQIALGLGYLFAPVALLRVVGHSAPSPDLLYPLGMLAARFLAYGVGFWIAAGEPARHALWIRLMVLIQAIDLGVGVFYTANGVVPLTTSAFPMFNAAWIALGLTFLALRAGAPTEAGR